MTSQTVKMKVTKYFCNVKPLHYTVIFHLIMVIFTRRSV